MEGGSLSFLHYSVASPHCRNKTAMSDLPKDTYHPQTDPSNAQDSSTGWKMQLIPDDQLLGSRWASPNWELSELKHGWAWPSSDPRNQIPIFIYIVLFEDEIRVQLRSIRSSWISWILTAETHRVSKKQFLLTSWVVDSCFIYKLLQHPPYQQYQSAPSCSYTSCGTLQYPRIHYKHPTVSLPNLFSCFMLSDVVMDVIGEDTVPHNRLSRPTLSSPPAEENYRLTTVPRGSWQSSSSQDRGETPKAINSWTISRSIAPNYCHQGYSISCLRTVQELLHTI